MKTQAEQGPRPVAGPFDLAVTQGWLFLKAEAATWAAERPRRIAKGEDLNLEIRPQDQEFISRAKLEECFLWMLAPDGPRPASSDHFDVIAAWYENLAEALALADLLIAEVEWQADEVKLGLALVAAAQSALRLAVAECDGYGDRDQLAAFEWLKEVAAEHEIFIQEGMKLDDPTDPSEFAAIAGRINAVAIGFGERQQQIRKRKKLLANVRHKASALIANNRGSLEASVELMAVVDEVVQAGIPPSNKELRDTLLPVLKRFPAQADVPDGFRLVVREIETFQQNVPPGHEEFSEDSEPVGIVQDARKLLKGRSAVLIGGDERAEAKESLEQALGLKELIWIKTTKHQSYLDFEPFIARPEVAIVLLAVRWSSHSFGEVRSLCERYGKPFVRLPGGYSANQLAQQIVTQAGKRLV